MAASLMPMPKQAFYGLVNGVMSPIVGGKVYTYAAGTLTPKDTYTTAAGNVANPNPVVLDARGEASVWLGSGFYDIVLKGADDALIWTQESVEPSLGLASAGAPTGSALVGFLQAGTDAVARTAQSKMRDRLCIFDFMTPAQISDVQSGSAAQDHTAAMDAALNAAVARKGILFMPAGTYRHNGRWYHASASYVTIEGEGESTVILNTDRTTNSAYSIHLVGDYITLRNFRHNGEKASLSSPVTERYGVLVNGSYALADNVTVHDTINNALILSGSRSLVFRECKIRDIGYDNASLNTGGILASSGTQIVISGCTVYNTGRSGIFVYESNHITIIGNSVDSCENGIRIDRTDWSLPMYATITGNTVSNGYGDGIRASGDFVTVSGNQIYKNTDGTNGAGISTAGGKNQTFTGNTITGNVIGIRLGYEQADTDKVTISGNTITDNTSNGVHLVPSSKSMTNVVIVGNNIIGNNSVIRVENCTGPAASLFAAHNHHALGTHIIGTATGWTFGSPNGYGETLTPSAGAITVKGDGVYGVSGTADITSINVCASGTKITLYFVSTAAGTGVTDGGNLKLNGNFVYTADDTITLVSNGTNWLEVCRSVN